MRRLKRGTYRGVLTVVDDFDKKITPRNFFVIRWRMKALRTAALAWRSRSC